MFIVFILVAEIAGGTKKGDVEINLAPNCDEYEWILYQIKGHGKWKILRGSVLQKLLG